ncbi:MAG: bifunctional glutamate N-acetyltransferase/amino-acid acetyltransferase ArgJ [Limnochordia bacterium]|jgi:glutamate N-acetyltransferase/amino-acid N-acetyltransferase
MNGTWISGGVTAPRGFLAAGVHTGIKARDLDLAIIYSGVPAVGAAVFTTNQVVAAPVIVSREHCGQGPIQGIVVNSGNANACTGEQGLADAREMAVLTAQALGLKPQQILVASTGVIGVPLPMDKIRRGIPQAVAALSPEGSATAVRGIMTTDTHVKECALVVEIGGRKVTIGGIAKGAGMIHPNMATMLAFLTTDCAITRPLLQLALKRAVERTFNRITVDGDTSTNDTAAILANGAAENPIIDREGPEFFQFQEALEGVARRLAHGIVRDGEGATKFIEIHVRGAVDEASAACIGKSIASSNLVKTAIYGCDANWGRILCAAGYSGVHFDPSKVDIYIGEEQVAAGGAGLEFDEDRARAILSQEEIKLTIDLHAGSGEALVWTCDLTEDYIKINASYRS